MSEPVLATPSPSPAPPPPADATPPTNGAAPPSGATPPQDAPIAAGGTPPATPEAPPYWPADWKQKVAEHFSAGNKDVMEKELRRLERISDPFNLYNTYRSIENTWATRNFVKLPGTDAKPEDIAEFHKSLGVPEKPEDYFSDLKLSNGAVIGEADKPMVNGFAAAVHKAGATPQVVSAALDWYFGNQEQQATAIDERDETFRTEATRTLKDEYGPAYKRQINNITSLFDVAPGGSDVTNDKSLYARLMGGRTADGHLIGNDPDMVRFLVTLAHMKNPAGSVVEDGDQTGQSVENEIASIEKRMREDRAGYNKDERMQARYRELVGARDKIQTRKRA